MKNLLTIILLVVIISCNEKSTGQSYNIKGYKNVFIGDFRCGVYIPPSYDASKKYPLVIYLHGHSDTTTWNFGWYHEPAALADPVILLTPKCPASQTGGWGNSWTSEISPMMKKTFEMIERIKKEYNVDEERIYIHGTSMGAIGTFGLIQKFPDMFTAGYAVCGWGNPEIGPQLAKVPFWIFHGSDDDVVPVQGSRGVYKAVTDLGGKQIRYTEFKGVKHNAWEYVEDKKVYPWLLSQRKGSATHGAPDKVPAVHIKSGADDAIVLEWDKAVETSGGDKKIWFYRIYKDGKMIGEVDGENSNFTDTSSDAKTRHDYAVSSVNYYFKESVPASAVQ